MKVVIQAWRELASPLAGGAEALVDHLAAGLHHRGHDVHVIAGGRVAPRDYAVTPGGGVYDQYLRAPFVRHKFAPRADVVIDTAAGMTYCSPLVRRQPTVLLIHHIHTEQWGQWFSPPIAALGRFFESRLVPVVYKNCLVIAVSDSTASALEKIGFKRDQIRIVHNVAEPPPADLVVARSTGPLFVALGRLVPHKRVNLLIEMWSQVQPIVGGRLVIIGEGPQREDLRALGVPGVEVLGRVDDDVKNRLLAEAWMLVHGASHEGWGVAITEAAMHGTPCLAFDVAGVCDAVVNGSTGILAEDPEQFVKHWIELGTEPRRIDEYGRAARRRAARFSATATADRFEEVILEAVERGRTRP